MTTTLCGISETTTTRNFVLWLFLNKHNVLWHVKICHDAKVMLWLLKKMTPASSDFMKIPQTVKEVAYQLMERCLKHAGCVDVRQQHENLVWRTMVYPKQEKPSSAFRHQDKPV